MKGNGSRFNFLCAMTNDGMLPCSFGFIGNCNWCVACLASAVWRLPSAVCSSGCCTDQSDWLCRRFVFEWWLFVMVLPHLRPGQVVVMDNASFHRAAILAPLLARFGVSLLFLPPYCPVRITISLHY